MLFKYLRQAIVMVNIIVADKYGIDFAGGGVIEKRIYYLFADIVFWNWAGIDNKIFIIRSS